MESIFFGASIASSLPMVHVTCVTVHGSHDRVLAVS